MIILYLIAFAILNLDHILVHGQDDDQPILQSVLTIESKSGSECPWPQLRLPSFIKPVHYDIYLHPNVTTHDYKGKISIFFKLTKSSKFIVVHLKELLVEEIAIKIKEKESTKQSEIRPSKLIHCPDSDLFYIEASKELASDQLYRLIVVFSRQLSDESLDGLYISKYTSSDGQDHKLVSTQFEPTSARKAFPCFDEPNLKATFTIKVVHDTRHNVYSNTEPTSSMSHVDSNNDGIDDRHDESPDNDDTNGKEKSAGIKITGFEKTVKMSTYLVAVIVSDFISNGTVSKKSGHKIHVLAPKEEMEKMKFAHESASKLVDHYEEFFGVKYPMSKLDLAAIPAFAAQAMENWGLVTFAAENLNFDEDTESMDDKELVAITIAHEFSHQWFGNLVTMEWWNDLWLNEGFATFMSMTGMEAIYPDMMSSSMFLSEVTHTAMIGDASRYTHPIEVSIDTPEDVFEAFDEITYEKTAALLRYLSLVIGMDTMKAGLRKYMEMYQFGNTVATNLWSSFGDIDVDGQDYQVEEVMNVWIQTTGYPVLDVKVKDGRITIKQKLFWLHPTLNSSASKAEDIKDRRWIIKLDFVTSQDPEKVFNKWMTTRQLSFKSPQLTDNIDWFKLNVNSAGYYRVNYEPKNWINLIKMLKTMDPNNPTIKTSDRAGLIDDALSLMKAGQVKAGMAMQLVTYLNGHETEYVPWTTALRHLDGICTKLKSNCAPFRKFVLTIMKPIIGKVGFEDIGTHLDKKLRSTILSTALNLNCSQVTDHFKKEFDSWKSGEKKSLNPNLKLVILAAGVRHGDQQDWDFVWNKFQSSRSPSERSVYIDALGRSPTVQSVSRLLDAALDKSLGTSGHQKNRVLLLASLIKNEIITSNQIDLWQWFRDNYDTLHKLVSPIEAKAYLELVQIISRTIDTEEGLSAVVSFLSEREEKEKTIKKISEVIEGNIYWKKVVQPKLIEWLDVYEKKMNKV